MFTNESSVKKIRQLIQEVKIYLELQKDYLKLELAEKLTLIISTLVLIIALVSLGMVVLFFLFISLAHLLAPYVGGLAASYAIIAGVILLVILLIYALRNKIIVNPIVNFLANILVNK